MVEISRLFDAVVVHLGKERACRTCCCCGDKYHACLLYCLHSSRLLPLLLFLSSPRLMVVLLLLFGNWHFSSPLYILFLHAKVSPLHPSSPLPLPFFSFLASLPKASQDDFDFCPISYRSRSTVPAARSQRQPRMGFCSSPLHEAEGRIPPPSAKAGPFSFALPSRSCFPDPSHPAQTLQTLAKRRDERIERSRPWAKSNSSASSSERQSSTSRSSPDALVKTKDRLPAASVECEQPMTPGEKHVSFGGVTVIEHPRWIDQTEHVCFPSPREPVPRPLRPSERDASWIPSRRPM